MTKESTKELAVGHFHYNYWLVSVGDDEGLTDDDDDEGAGSRALHYNYWLGSAGDGEGADRR